MGYRWSSTSALRSYWYKTNELSNWKTYNLHFKQPVFMNYAFAHSVQKFYLAFGTRRFWKQHLAFIFPLHILKTVSIYFSFPPNHYLNLCGKAESKRASAIKGPLTQSVIGRVSTLAKPALGYVSLYEEAFTSHVQKLSKNRTSWLRIKIRNHIEKAATSRWFEMDYLIIKIRYKRRETASSTLQIKPPTDSVSEKVRPNAIFF